MADSETRWMSYDELAKALGIAPDSARRLVARRRWHRKPGNDGRALIAVPLDRLTPDVGPDIPPDVGPENLPDVAPDVAPDTITVVAVLERHVSHLEAELGRVRDERDALRADVDEARSRMTELSAEAAVSGALRDTVEALKGALSAEKAHTLEVRADRDRLYREATAPRGLLAWLRRA